MSIQANADAKIGDWTATKLIRFLKHLFEVDPPAFGSRAQIQDLLITSLLTVNDQVKFVRDPNFHLIGGTGEPAFTNAWVNFGSPNNPAGFWKDPLGIVHLRGVIKSGTVGLVAFTLPVGSRPLNAENLTVFSNTAFGYLLVTSGGAVIPTAPSNNTSVSLDGLTFKAV